MRLNISLKQHLIEMRDLFKEAKKVSPMPDRIDRIIEIYKYEIKVAK